MIRRRPRRPRGPAGPALAAVGLVCLVSLGPAQAATGSRVAAVGTSHDIRITVTALAPAALESTSSLALDARIVNASDETLVGVGARLRLQPLPFIGRDDLDAYATAEDEVGTVVEPSLVDVAPELAPGESARVRIRVPVAELGLPSGFGVHALTLELRVDDPDGARRTAGSVRTFVVDAQASSVPTVRATWLWPLVGTPARGPDGILPKEAAQALGAQLAEGGRLGGLLDAAQGSPVTMLVDGALLEDVRSLATGRGLATDAQPDPAAATWLGRLSAQQAAGADVRALPYADPDLTAVVRARMPGYLKQARTLGVDVVSSVLGRSAGPAPAWPGVGRINRATLETLARQGMDEVVLDSASLAPQEELPGTPDAITTLNAAPRVQAVAADQALSSLLTAGPSALGGLVLARQRVLAETAMIAAERPGDPRSVVAAPDRRWAPNPGWAAAVAGLSAPWLIRVDLRDLEADPGDAPSRNLEPYGDAATQAEVSAAQLANVRAARAQLRTFATAVADPERLLDQYLSSMLSTQSTAWRGDGAAPGAQYTRTVTSAVRSTVTSVRLLPRGQVTLSSRTGIVPFAVQNDFDQAVQIRIQMTATPSIRLSSDASEVFTVPAGRTASVDVAAEATTNATFPVVATLLTPDGEELGEPVRFTLRATGYGQVARIVVGGALVLLAIAVVLRVARRIRTAHRPASGTLGR